MNNQTPKVESNKLENEGIAVIGMSGHFPGADNLAEFWSNLINGVESIRFFTAEELFHSQHPNSDRINHPDFIPAKGYLDKADYFSAEFFKFSPNKAKTLDPQIRILLECVWEAWENAGYDIKKYPGKVGTYATSSSFDSYWQKNLTNGEYVNDYDIFISNAKDFLATQIAYQYNFKGPALNIQTACSSSLVAIVQACDDLLNNKCDIAVVAAACVTFPLKNGYLFKKGMIYSKDGRCCAFGADASGIVPGNGAGVVLLKRLSQAKQDGDLIYATICGYAINNDGRDKLSFTAPSIDGQYDVLKQAALSGNVDFNTIGYIEAHGSGTALGDQIEFEALKQYIPQTKQRSSPCYLGSVKTNIGHLDVAAGMAGFIKTVLTLYHGKIPKSLHAEVAHPNLKLSDSAFKIPTNTIEWNNMDSVPRRAGVSSFGVGGTNAHIILEQTLAAKTEDENSDVNWHLLPLSALTSEELEKKQDQLAMFIQNKTKFSLEEIAFTLQTGRVNFPLRAAVICRDYNEAIESLYLLGSDKLLQETKIDTAAKIAFLFSDSLPVNHALKVIAFLCKKIKNFENGIKTCAEIATDTLKYNFFQRLFDNTNNDTLSTSTSLDQHIINFSLGYTFANCLISAGINPQVLLGYGFGEFAAACCSGIFSLADAIKLIQLYSERQESSVSYQILSVLLSPTELEKIFENQAIKIIAVNAPRNCFIRIENNLLNEVEILLENEEVVFERIYSHHYHVDHPQDTSTQLNLFKTVQFNRNSKPITKTMVSDLNITQSSYWFTKIFSSEPIDYLNTVTSLLLQKVNVFLEIGSSEQLCRWVQQTNQASTKQKLLILPGFIQKNAMALESSLLTNLARIWIAGIAVDWASIIKRNAHKKVPLPTYPFTRNSYLSVPTQLLEIEPKQVPNIQVEQGFTLYKTDWIEDKEVNVARNQSPKNFILVENGFDLINKITESFYMLDNTVKLVSLPYEDNKKCIDDHWLNERCSAWKAIFLQYSAESELYVLIEGDGKRTFYDLMALVKALSSLQVALLIKLYVFVDGIAKIHQSDRLNPDLALILGPILCLPLEHPNLYAKCIDINSNERSSYSIEKYVDELQKNDCHNLVILRGNKRYLRHLSRTDDHKQKPALKFRKNGVYLITGGLGGIGLQLASYLAKSFAANLILISRSPIPDASEWGELLATAGIEANLADQLIALIEIKMYANQLLVYSADVANTMEMTTIVTQVRNRFGHIDGVIHAASHSPEGVLHEKSFAGVESLFYPKMNGLITLDKLFSKENLDFMLLFSSLNTIDGAVGATEYVSANAFLNSVANQNTAKFPVISINWDTWREVGMRHAYLTKKNFLEMSAYALGYGKWRNFLIEHKLDNQIVVVGALLLELCILEFRKRNNTNLIAMSQVYFMMPGIVQNLEKFKVYAKVNTKLDIEFKTSETSSGKLIFRGTLAENNSPKPKSIDIESLLQKFQNVVTLNNDKERYTKAGRIAIGPHWDCMVWVKKINTTYLAKIALPEKFTDELANVVLHPSLLDIGYSFHGQFLAKLHLPFYIEDFRVFGSLPAEFYSWVEIKSINEEAGTCISDVVLCSLTGDVLLIAKGLVLKAASNGVFEKKLENISANLQGLTSAEGLAALDKIMQHPYPEIYVSKKEITEKIILGNQKTIITNENYTYDYIKEGKNLVETVKNIWIKLLGQNSISGNDSFFDLGGDSLLAIEICYAIKVKTGIHIAPNVLLERPIFSDFLLSITEKVIA